MEGLFNELSTMKGLEFLEATSAEDLKAQLQSIRLPIKLICIYHGNGKHIAWIQAPGRIKKVSKKVPQ